MLKVRLKRPGKFVYEECEPPKLKKGEAIIKVAASGICGSDIHAYEGKLLQVVPGHEFGGIIEEINEEDSEFKTGMKVVINPSISCGKCFYCKRSLEYQCDNRKMIGDDLEGSMKEKISVPISNIYKLPDSFDLDYSPLIEPTAICVHAIGLTKIENNNVLIIGTGSIGLLMQRVCKLKNNRIITTYRRPFTEEISQMLVADYAINIKSEKKLNDTKLEKKLYDIKESLGKESDNADIKKFLGKEKIDVIIDCVGAKETIEFSIDTVRKSGKVLLVGAPFDSEINEEYLLKLIVKEIRFLTTYLYTYSEFGKARDYVVNNIIDVKPLASKFFPLNQANEAYEYKMKNRVAKVIFKV